MSQYTKEYIEQELLYGVKWITFTKIDGSSRDMRCTLDLSRIPPKDHPKGPKKDNPYVLAVFDLEKNAWRSFRIDSVTNMW